MQSKPWLVLEILTWNTYSSGKPPPLQHTAEKLINLYVNDNIGVGMNSMSMARGTPRAPSFTAGSWMNHGQPLETRSRRRGWGRTSR